MRRTRILLALATLAGLAAVAAASGVVYLLLELDGANDSLLATQTALDDTVATLARLGWPSQTHKWTSRRRRR